MQRERERERERECVCVCVCARARARNKGGLVVSVRVSLDTKRILQELWFAGSLGSQLKDNFFLSVLRKRKVCLWSALQKVFCFFL